MKYTFFSVIQPIRGNKKQSRCINEQKNKADFLLEIILYKTYKPCRG